MALHEAYVSAGRVPCPRRPHDVDIETCLQCRLFQSLSEGQPQKLVCGGAPSLSDWFNLGYGSRLP